MLPFLSISALPILKGLGLTLFVAFSALIIGLILAFIFALLEQSKFKPLAWLISLFVLVIRGLPEIIVVFGFSFLIPALLILFSDGFMLPNWLGGFLIQIEIPDSLFYLPPVYFGIAALAILYAAYASQTLRGAFKSIPKGQKEAAETLGLSAARTFFKITLPQIWQHALPGLSNQWLTLLKDTALVSLIGVADMMKVLIDFSSNPAYSSKALLFYLVGALIYLMISILSQKIIQRIENRACHHLNSMT